MTSLASREMTEQEMINTCTAPQMAHLIQVLRQTIRNKDKEIERWVDMVRDGELDPPEPKPRLAEPETPTLCAKCNDHIIADDGAVCEICAETMDTIITELQARIAELEAELKAYKFALENAIIDRTLGGNTPLAQYVADARAELNRQAQEEK